jgi:hypothetical protein
MKRYEKKEQKPVYSVMSKYRQFDKREGAGRAMTQS